MKQKDNLQYHAVQNFITEYNCTHKRKLRFIRLCKPNMPDTLCCLNQKEVGIEVTHTYGTGQEAAMRLGNLNSEDISEKIHRKRRVKPLNLRALNSLNRILSDKGEKTYEFHPTWLLIRNAFAMWSLADYRKHRSEILFPDIHPFHQIWLLCDRYSAGKSGIKRLA